MSKQNTEQKEKSERGDHTGDVPMPLTSHLGELRKRLVHTLIVIIVGTVFHLFTDRPLCCAFFIISVFTWSNLVVCQASAFFKGTQSHLAFHFAFISTFCRRRSFRLFCCDTIRLRFLFRF